VIISKSDEHLGPTIQHRFSDALVAGKNLVEHFLRGIIVPQKKQRGMGGRENANNFSH
jgi:hypothetical protein